MATIELARPTGAVSAGPVALRKPYLLFLADVEDPVTAKTAFGLAATASDEDVIDVMISHVDRQLEAVNSAAADMGSVAMRLDLQQEFVSKLSDSIEAGIGRLVDADMNEESTRLKALQTQQQLGIQSLSIANSSAEGILSLFR